MQRYDLSSSHASIYLTSLLERMDGFWSTVAIDHHCSKRHGTKDAPRRKGREILEFEKHRNEIPLCLVRCMVAE